MATVSPRRNLAESHRRVRHPLQKLRGYIRGYVSTEGAALLLLFVAAWFWVGLLLDYEAFNLLHIDWVQETPAWVRTLTLGGLFALLALVGLGMALDAGLKRKGGGWLTATLVGWVTIAVGALLGAVIRLLVSIWLGAASELIALFLLSLAGLVLAAGLTVVAGSVLFRLTRKAVPTGWYLLVVVPVLVLYLVGWGMVGALAGGGRIGPWLAALLICVLLFGPVAVMVLKRLLVDFRDDALALVLERRYPKQLGDRLITAVELANAHEYTRYGYSTEMIEQTIHDAADRVEPLPVQQVFDWSRLVRLGLLVAFATVGLYLLVGIGFCVAQSVKARRASLAGFGELNRTLGIWAERNLLLENTLWPRQAYLEYVGFPESGEMRIPQNTPPGGIVVRAYRWVIADKESPEGWRPLRWGDLRPELLGTVPPALPGDFPSASAESGPPVDDVELRLDQFPLRHAGPDQDLPARWVIAQDVEEAPWRPLRWGDLTSERLGGVARPELPGGWPDDIDGVENQLARAEEAGGPALDAQQLADLRSVLRRLERLAALRQTFDQLEELAGRSSMRRTLRMLKIPEDVFTRYKGKDTNGDIKSSREPGNLYKIGFPVLKESVTFTVRGEDYYTPRRQITTVPPPVLTDLWRDEYQPAYLHYLRPRGEDAAKVLKGQKQVFRNRGVSRLGSETSRIEVPAGTDVILYGKTDKPLRAVTLKRRDGSLPFEAAAELLRDAEGDAREFRVRFDDVRPGKERLPNKPAVYDFDLAFTDTDNVTSTRNIVIKPVEDAAPTASLEIVGIRQSPKGHYLITPRALVPFAGKVEDAQGLDRVYYAYTLAPLDEERDREGGQAIMMLGGIGGSPTQALVAAALASILGAKKSDAAPGAAIRRVPLGDFEGELFPRGVVLLPVPELRQRLNEGIEQTAQRLKDSGVKLELNEIIDRLKSENPFRPLLKAYDLKAFDPLVNRDDETGTAFDLLKLTEPKDRSDLENAEKPGSQRRFLLQVWGEVLDNDIETGPNRGRSKDTFTFHVIPEEDLRLEILKDEETIRYRVQEIYERLRGPGSVEDKLVKLLGDLADPKLTPDGFGPAIARAGELRSVVEKCQDETGKVHLDYQRILRELKLNRVQRSKIDQVENRVVGPLGRLLVGFDADMGARKKRVGYPNTVGALTALGQNMDAAQQDYAKAKNSSDAAKMLAQARQDAAEARDQVKELADRLELIMKDMEDTLKFDDVIKRGRALLEGVTSQQMAFDRWHKWLQKILIDELLKEPEKPKP